MHAKTPTEQIIPFQQNNVMWHVLWLHMFHCDADRVKVQAV